MLNFYLTMFDTDEEISKFEELYNLYRQDMIKVANSILKDTYEAEDAVHEAFLRIAKNFSKIPHINCPETRAYLIIIVKNISLDIYRGKKRRRTESIDELSDLKDINISIESDVFFRMDVETIKKGAKKLSDDYYTILLLEQNGYKTDELASLLGISYENARKQLMRAKLKLKTLIETELLYNDK